jgi:hypothetical protein
MASLACSVGPLAGCGKLCQPSFACAGFSDLDLLEQRNRSPSIGHDYFFALLGSPKIVRQAVFEFFDAIRLIANLCSQSSCFAKEGNYSQTFCRAVSSSKCNG